MGETLQFHYIKSNSFRVVHCDGVWGGGTPRGLISMSFYSERSPIPVMLTHEVLSDETANKKTLGEETNKEIKEGIIREVDVAVLMDLPMAKSLQEWLERHIAILEQSPKTGQNNG